MSRTPSPTSVPPNLNDSLEEDEVFFGQTGEDEERARQLCDEFEHALSLVDQDEPEPEFEDELTGEQTQESVEDAMQGDMLEMEELPPQEEEEEVTEPLSAPQPIVAAVASVVAPIAIRRDISNDDTVEEIDLDEIMPPSPPPQTLATVMQTPPRVVATKPALMRPALLSQPSAPVALLQSLLPASVTVLPPPPAFAAVHSPVSPLLQLEQPLLVASSSSSVEEVTSDLLQLDGLVIEAPTTKEGESALAVAPAETTAEVGTLSQVRATLLKLKANRGVGTSRVPRLQSHIPSVASAITTSKLLQATPSATAATQQQHSGIPTLSRIPMSGASRPPVSFGNSSTILASVPSSKVAAPAAPVATVQTQAFAVAIAPIAAPIIVAAAPAPQVVVAAAAAPSPLIPSITELLARSSSLSLASSTISIATVAGVPASQPLLSMVAPASSPSATAASSYAPMMPVMSKLSTLASTKQLASPAPAKKTMPSVFQRTASLQAQVAALQRNTLQQQQLAALTSTLNANKALYPSALGRSTSGSSAVAALLSRPVSAPPAPPAAVAGGAIGRRGVLWRDEDAAGELEEVRFMSPPCSPEKELPASSQDQLLSLSASYAQFLRTSKPMPDLTKTPTKSCLRRSASMGAIPFAMPAHVAHLSAFKNENAVEGMSLSSIAAPLFTTPSSTITPVASAAVRAAAANAVQSGARRVPNLAPKVTPGLTGALRTIQPLAAAPLSGGVSTDKPAPAALLKRPASSNATNGLLR